MLLSSLMLLASCGKKDEPSPKPTPPSPPDKASVYTEEQTSKKGYEHKGEKVEIDLKDNVVFVKKDINDQLVSDKDNEIVYKDSPYLTKVKQGDILFSSGEEDPSKAYAYKIVGVEKKDGNIHYKVKPAAMAEVFDEYKQTFDLKPDLAKVKLYDIDAQLEKFRSARVGDKLRANNLFDFDDKGNPKIKLELDDKGRIKFRYEGGVYFFDVVVFDADEDYKTKNDQLRFNFGIGAEEERKLQMKFKNRRLTLDGRLRFNTVYELEYGFEHNIEDAIKEGAENPPKILEKAIGLVKKTDEDDIIEDERIKIASIPMSSIGIAQLNFDIYIKVGLGIDGKLKMYAEYGPIYADFNYDRTYTDIYSEFYEINSDEAKLHDMSVKGDVTVGGKLGVALGPVIYTPVFQDGKGNMSYCGILTDIYGHIEAKVSAELKKDELSLSGTDLSGSIVTNMSMGFAYEPYIDGRLYTWKLFDPVDLKFSLFKRPEYLDDPWKFDFAWLWLRQGQEEKLDLNISNFVPVGVVDKPNIISAEWNDDMNALIRGKEVGSARIDLIYKNTKKRSGKIWTYVHKGKPVKALDGKGNLPELKGDENLPKKETEGKVYLPSLEGDKSLDKKSDEEGKGSGNTYLPKVKGKELFGEGDDASNGKSHLPAIEGTELFK